MKLKDVQVLTLHEGAMTTGRRSSPVPQLKLAGGSAANDLGPLSTIQCYNRGHDGYDVQVGLLVSGHARFLQLTEEHEIL